MTLMPSIGKCPVCHRSSGEFLIRPIRLPADADRIAELEAKVRELEAERDELLDLRKFLDDVKQGTMADERIKFVHNLITDLAASRQQVARLVEALITIDQKLEAAVLCEAKTGQLMQASPLRLDVYKALAAVEKERHNGRIQGPRRPVE